MLRSMKIGKRLTLGFSLLVLISIFVGASSYYRLIEIKSNLSNLAERRLPAALLVGKMNSEFLLIRLHLANLLSAKTASEKDTLNNALIKAVQQYNETATQTAVFHKTPAGRATFEKALTAKTKFDALYTELVQHINANNIDDALQLRSEKYSAAAADVTSALKDLAEYQRQTGIKQAEQAEHSISLAEMTALLAVIFAVGFGAVLAVVFTRSLVRPMEQAVTASQAIAAGDLSFHFADDEPDEAGELIRAMVQMQKQLQSTLDDINQSASQLTVTSEELSVVTESSAYTMQQQNSELEMAATAVTELTTAIEEVARSAASTSDNSNKADQTSQQGQQKVNLTIDSIQTLEGELQVSRTDIIQLSDHVNEIGSVLDVIRAIAEQTNLLALNAAIEAARAGESGRGFAVVADEVRALAHRTQQSTKMIEQTISKVKAGTQKTVVTMENSSERATQTLKLAIEAGEALKLITQSIGQISDQNMTIASAAEEQATVAREVDKNLINIKDLSVQTSTGADETKASSIELAQLAEHLSGLVKQFKV
jgi:methyl-accepting chemotaxis protein